MARASVSVIAISRAGKNISDANKTTIALADGIEFENTGKEFLYLENTDTSTCAVTIQTGRQVDGLAVADRTVTLQAAGTAGDKQLVGPFSRKDYNQSGGKIFVDAATDAVVKAIVFQLTPENT